MNLTISKKAFGLVGLVLLADQITKIWVKLNMRMNEGFEVFGLDWWIIHFTENEGMAFGLSFGGDYGKLFLSLFRIVAICFIAYYLTQLIKKKEAPGLIYSIALILAGATGNILDSAFYGVLFSESTVREVAMAFPPDGGYAPFLYGKVVDMLYFPLWAGYLPDWLPFIGGGYFEFFQPVFNLADTSITTGVCIIIVWQRRYFGTGEAPQQKEEVAEIEDTKAAAIDTPSPLTEEVKKGSEDTTSEDKVDEAPSEPTTPKE